MLEELSFILKLFNEKIYKKSSSKNIKNHTQANDRHETTKTGDFTQLPQQFITNGATESTALGF